MSKSLRVPTPALTHPLSRTCVPISKNLTCGRERHGRGQDAGRSVGRRQADGVHLPVDNGGSGGGSDRNGTAAGKARNIGKVVSASQRVSVGD